MRVHTYLRGFATTVLALLILNGCSLRVGPQPLEPLTTDGCSLFPDDAILSCCTDHDIDYWQGGTAARRKQVDERFRRCVEDVSGSVLFATLAHRGVRIGGNPYLPPAAGWGYGWPYPRRYAPLLPEERARVLASMHEALMASEAACSVGDDRACHLHEILARRDEIRAEPSGSVAP